MLVAERNDPEAWSERARVAPTSWAAALWSQQGQTDRFSAALAHLDLHSFDRLLDFGCGTGELSEYVGWADYLGVDSSPGMLARAREEHPDRRFSDQVEGRFTKVAAIGVWNLATEEEALSDIGHLLERCSVRLVASLHKALIPPDRLADLAERHWPERWQIDGSYRENDLMLVLRP